jgi:hypothetical protein
MEAGTVTGDPVRHVVGPHEDAIADGGSGHFLPWWSPWECECECP